MVFVNPVTFNPSYLPHSQLQLSKCCTRDTTISLNKDVANWIWWIFNRLLKTLERSQVANCYKKTEGVVSGFRWSLV